MCVLSSSRAPGACHRPSELGHACLSLDVASAPHHDLTDPNASATVEGWIASGCVCALWIATPCNSWSRARHGPLGSAWGPSRDARHILGLPGLSARDTQAIRTGNRLARVSARLIRRAIAHGLPVFLENPASSFLWRAPCLASALSDPSCLLWTFDQCQMGARWRKRTRIASWNAPSELSFDQRCSGRHGRCSRTGRHHIVLTGRDKASGHLWTHLAAAYPPAMCTAAARWMNESWELSRFNHHQRLGRGF